MFVLEDASDYLLRTPKMYFEWMIMTCEIFSLPIGEASHMLRPPHTLYVRVSNSNKGERGTEICAPCLQAT